MANYLEVTTTSATRFVPATSRYANSTVVYYTDRKLVSFETYKRGAYSPSPGDKFTVVDKSVEYRPDLVSYHAYGVSDYWWRIMEANGMKDVLEFKSGVNIRVPDNIFF